MGRGRGGEGDGVGTQVGNLGNGGYVGRTWGRGTLVKEMVLLAVQCNPSI